MTATAATAETSGELFGHPKGLYVCFATELWERFSFYGMKYLLLLYLTKYHLFTDAMGLDVLGAYAGLVYALPVIGGMLADRYLGMRKAVLFGGILLVLGHLLMAVEGHQAVNYAKGTVLKDALTLADGSVLAAGTVLAEDIVMRDTGALNVFYMALALIVVGVGFLKPNISTIVGKLYPDGDARRDSGFTIFYMGINIGSFVATLLCGWLGETYGWGYGFGAAGIGMVFGLVTFTWGQKYLHGHAEPAEPEKLKEKVFGPLNREVVIYLGSFLSLGLVWWVVQHEPIVHTAQNMMLLVAIVGLVIYGMFVEAPESNKALAYAMGIGAMVIGGLGILLPVINAESAGLASIMVYIGLALGVALVLYGFTKHNTDSFSQTVVLMVLIISTIVFWALFEQSAGSMTLYADRVLDRTMGDGEIKASMFGSLNAGFIMLLAIPFALMWVALAKRNLEPSTPVKFGLGIILAGLGFGALVLGASMPNEMGKVAMIWLVLAYLLHTMGELCLSPVGLSAVTKLSPKRVVGVSMGTWFLATALSETVATRIGKMAAVSADVGEKADVSAILGTYTELYTFLMWLGIGVGVFMLVISPILRKGMRGIH